MQNNVSHGGRCWQTHGHRVNLTHSGSESGGTVINKHKYLLQVYSVRLPNASVSLSTTPIQIQTADWLSSTRAG